MMSDFVPVVDLPVGGVDNGFKESAKRARLLPHGLGADFALPHWKDVVDEVGLSNLVDQLIAVGHTLCQGPEIRAEHPIALIQSMLKYHGLCTFDSRIPSTLLENTYSFKMRGSYLVTVGWSSSGEPIDETLTTEEVRSIGMSIAMPDWAYQVRYDVTLHHLLQLETFARSGQISAKFYHMWLEMVLPVFQIEAGTNRYGNGYDKIVSESPLLWELDKCVNLDLDLLLNENTNLASIMPMKIQTHDKYSAIGPVGCRMLLQHMCSTGHREFLSTVLSSVHLDFGYLNFVMLFMPLTFVSGSSYDELLSWFQLTKPWQMNLINSARVMKDRHTVLVRTNHGMFGRLCTPDLVCNAYGDYFCGRGHIKTLDDDMENTKVNLFSTLYSYDWEKCVATNSLYWQVEIENIFRLWDDLYSMFTPKECCKNTLAIVTSQSMGVASGSAGRLRAEIEAKMDRTNEVDIKVANDACRKLLIENGISCGEHYLKDLHEPKISPISKRIVLITNKPNVHQLNDLEIEFRSHVPENNFQGLLIVHKGPTNQLMLERNCFLMELDSRKFNALLDSLLEHAADKTVPDLVKMWRRVFNGICAIKADFVTKTFRLTKATARANMSADYIVEMLERVNNALSSAFQKNEVARGRILYSVDFFHTMLSLRVIGRIDRYIGLLKGLDSATPPAVVALQYREVSRELVQMPYNLNNETIVVCQDPADFNKSHSHLMLSVDRLVSTLVLVRRNGIATSLSDFEAPSSNKVDPDYISASVQLAESYLQSGVAVAVGSQIADYQMMASGMLSGMQDTSGINGRANYRFFWHTEDKYCELLEKPKVRRNDGSAQRQGRGDDMMALIKAWLEAALKLAIAMGTGLKMSIVKQRIGIAYEYLKVIGDCFGVNGYPARAMSVLFFSHWETSQKQCIRARCVSLMSQLGQVARRQVPMHVIEVFVEVFYILYKAVTLNTTNGKETIFMASRDVWSTNELYGGLGMVNHPLYWNNKKFDNHIPVMMNDYHELDDWVNGKAVKDVVNSAFLKLQESFGDKHAKKIAKALIHAGIATSAATTITEKDKVINYKEYCHTMRSFSDVNTTVEMSTVDVSKDGGLIYGVVGTIVFSVPKIGKSMYARGNVLDVDNYGGQWSSVEDSSANTIRIQSALNHILKHEIHKFDKACIVLVGGDSNCLESIYCWSVMHQFHVVVVYNGRAKFYDNQWQLNPDELFNERKNVRKDRQFTRGWLDSQDHGNKMIADRYGLMVTYTVADAILRHRPAMRVPRLSLNKHSFMLSTILKNCISEIKLIKDNEKALAEMRHPPRAFGTQTMVSPDEMAKLAKELNAQQLEIVDAMEKAINCKALDSAIWKLNSQGGMDAIKCWDAMKIRVPGAVSFVTGGVSSFCRVLVARAMFVFLYNQSDALSYEEWGEVGTLSVTMLAMWTMWDNDLADFFKN